MPLRNQTLAMADDSHSMTINDEIRLMGGSEMMKKTSPRSRMSSLAAVPLHLSTLLDGDGDGAGGSASAEHKTESTATATGKRNRPCTSDVWDEYEKI